MLATLGERPVPSLATPHRFMTAARAALDSKLRLLLAIGWWFNTETNTLVPGVDDKITLGGDVLAVKPPAAKSHYQMRGSKLYDGSTGTYTITESLTCEIVRLLPFEDVPESVAAYIAADAVVKFQSDYDGDTDKLRRLREDRDTARMLAVADQTRYTQANLLDNNPRLARLRYKMRRLAP